MHARPRRLLPTVAVKLLHLNTMLVDRFVVDSPSVSYSDESITSSYKYDTTELEVGGDGQVTVRPREESIEFRTARKVPKVGYARNTLLHVPVTCAVHRGACPRVLHRPLAACVPFWRTHAIGELRQLQVFTQGIS